MAVLTTNIRHREVERQHTYGHERCLAEDVVGEYVAEALELDPAHGQLAAEEDSEDEL